MALSINSLLEKAASEVNGSDNTGYIPRTIAEYETTKYSTPSPEIRQMVMKYIDPLTLNFRVIINIKQKSGLLAGFDKVYGKNEISENPSDYPTNSALAYFLRIGDKARFYMLIAFGLDFIDLVKNYDFLFQTIEGIEEINDANPYEAWTDQEVTITLRETIESRVHRVMSIWRYIWYDNNRNIVVLPNNLQKIDLGILIYNSGYYNRDLYDLTSESDTNEDHYMFPTIRKLAQLNPIVIPDPINGKGLYPFIYHTFRFPSAGIKQKTSTGYFDTVSNVPGSSGDFITTKFIFEFFSVQYSNCYYGSWRNRDITRILQLSQVMSDWSWVSKSLGVDSSLSSLSSSNKTWSQKFTDSWKKTTKNIIEDQKVMLQNYYNKTIEYVYRKISESSKIGKASIDLITRPDLSANILSKSLTTPVIKLMDKYGSWIDTQLATNTDTFLQSNFSDEYINWYRQAMYDVANGARLFDNPPVRVIFDNNSNTNTPSLMNDIKLESSNQIGGMTKTTINNTPTTTINTITSDNITNTPTNQIQTLSKETNNNIEYTKSQIDVLTLDSDLLNKIEQKATQTSTQKVSNINTPKKSSNVNKFDQENTIIYKRKGF